MRMTMQISGAFMQKNIELNNDKLKMLQAINTIAYRKGIEFIFYTQRVGLKYAFFLVCLIKVRSY